MHRSRLTGALFDVPAGAFAAEATFWSGALGSQSKPVDGNPEYVHLEDLFSGLEVMVQKIGDGAPARVHLDVETDDVEAEVGRLERLGATRVQFVKTWWIMRDPAGLLFCVVRVQAPEEFEARATKWDDTAT